jgi:predicted GH43/DUF377 family glycosyl hydrolase
LSDDWRIGPFTEQDGPVVVTRPDSRLTCPVSKREVRWATKDVFNPGAVVRDGEIHLLFRAEDATGLYGGTSRIGTGHERRWHQLRCRTGTSALPR